MRRLEKLERIPAEDVDEIVADFRADGATSVDKKQGPDGTWIVEAHFAEVLRVTAMTLRLREGPGTNFSMIAVLPLGTRVEVQSRQEAWCAVRVLDTGQTGWVAERYLSWEASAVG